jgi:hypothetical protein
MTAVSAPASRLSFLDRWLTLWIFAALPVASLDRVSLQARLTEIGHGEGATSRRPDVA